MISSLIGLNLVVTPHQPIGTRSGLNRVAAIPPPLKKIMTFFGSLNNYFSISFVITMLIISGRFFSHKIKSLNMYSLKNCRLLMNDSNENS